MEGASSSSVSVSTRIRDITRWSFERNECTLTLDHDNGKLNYTARLPPVASPNALYTSATLDPTKRVVLVWGPCVVDNTFERTLERLRGVGQTELNAVRLLFRLPPDANETAIVEKARVSDVQIVDVLGNARGVLDAVCMNDAQMQRILENYRCFGRSFKRNMKRPCCLPFATDADLCASEHDFSRAEDLELRRLAAASTAWHACRRARAAGTLVTRDLVAESYGNDVANELASRLPLVPRLSTSPSLTIDETLQFVAVSDAFKRTSAAPPSLAASASTSADAVFWFAPCLALAETSSTKTSGWAVHELAGTVFVTSVDGDGAHTHTGAVVTPGGLTFSSQICASECGASVFPPRSLRRIGLFCDQREIKTWPASLVAGVLGLVEAGGVVFVTADDATVWHVADEAGRTPTQRGHRLTADELT